jgi:DNA-nicking Smr family endonuclease
MDFGSILEQWDQQSKEKPKEKPKDPLDPDGQRPTKVAPPKQEPKVDPLTAWLRINGVTDKDVEMEGDRVSAAERRRALIKKRPDAVVDLHGLTQAEAWNQLETFFAQSKAQGAEKVLIIHGKGNHSEGEAVLQRTTREFLERCPYAGQSGIASVAEGGSGATWVLLKRVKDRDSYRSL